MITPKDIEKIMRLLSIINLEEGLNEEQIANIHYAMLHLLSIYYTNKWNKLTWEEIKRKIYIIEDNKNESSS